MADASRKRLDWTVRALEQLETQFEYAVREQLIDAEVLRGRIARTAGLIESHSGIGTPGRSRGTRGTGQLLRNRTYRDGDGRQRDTARHVRAEARRLR